MSKDRKVSISLFGKDKTGGAFSSIRKNMNKLKSQLKGAFNIGKKLAIGGGAAGIALAYKSIDAASKYNEVLSKFDTVFKDQAEGAKKWSNTFAKSVGISQTEALKFMGSMQDLFVPLGFARDEATDFSKKVTTLAVDLASFNNVKSGDVVRDIQAALTGSAETMKKYGVVINQTKINQELLNMGIHGGAKAATDQQKATAILNMIMRGTTDAQGDAERTSKSWANTMKRLWATVNNLQVAIGNKLIPVMKPLLAKFENLIASNKDLIAGNLKEWIDQTYAKLKTWSADGTFLLWWERIKLTIMGVSVAFDGLKSVFNLTMVGLKSSMDYISASLAKVLQLKNQVEYLYEGNTKEGYAAAARATEYGEIVDKYTASAAERSVNAIAPVVERSRQSVNDYNAQAQKVADLQVKVNARQEGANIGAAVNQAVNSAIGQVKAGMSEALRNTAAQKNVLAATAGV